MGLIRTQRCVVINSEGGGSLWIVILSKGVMWQLSIGGTWQNVITRNDNPRWQRIELTATKLVASVTLLLSSFDWFELHKLKKRIGCFYCIEFELSRIPERINSWDSICWFRGSSSWCLYAWIRIPWESQIQDSKKERQITNSSLSTASNSFILLANPTDHSGFVEEESLSRAGSQSSQFFYPR